MADTSSSASSLHGASAVSAAVAGGAAAPAAKPSLGSSTRAGIKWSSLGVLVNVALQLGFGAMLARLVSPAEFGILAMSMLGLRLCGYLSQIGMSVTLASMQRAELAEKDIRFALGVSWLAGGLACAVVWLVAPAVARYFRHPEVQTVAQGLALLLLVQALAAVPMALLRRQMRFGVLAVLETASYGLGYGALGVFMAWQGFGVWSLVAALFGQQGVLLLAGWWLAKVPLRPSLQGDRRKLMSYGARHTLISFLEFLAANIDTSLIGRFLGDTALGLYNRAFMLTNQPVERVAGVLSRVLFPLFATIQTNRAQVGSVYLLGVCVIGVVGGSVSLALCGAAGPAVAVLLGPNWVDAVPVVRVLALAIPLMFMSQVAGVMCDALAWLPFKLRVQGVGLLLALGCMAALYRYGLVGIALGLLMAELLRFALYFVLLTRRLHCTGADARRVLAAVVLSCALSWVLVSATLWLTSTSSLGPFLSLLCAMAAGGLAVMLAAVLMVSLTSSTPAGRMAAQHLAPWRQLEHRLGLTAPAASRA
jgi:lipopolysaccharide exporter